MASQPLMGRMMALATRDEVRTQVASSVVAERLPAMWGRLTLTTEVSSPSITALDSTATATRFRRAIILGQIISSPHAGNASGQSLLRAPILGCQNLRYLLLKAQRMP